MHVFVDAADDEEFVVVSNRLSSEKFFRFLQGTFHSFDLSDLGVKSETIRYPAIVSSENQNLRIVESKATDCVTS